MPEPAQAPDTHDNTAAAVGASAGDVVYTALFGRYESLIEEECALDSDAEFICFTDDPSLTSKTWRVELVEPRFPMDPIRSARWVKVFGDESIWQGFDRSLWVDNRVSLKADPTEILDSLLEEPQADMALFEHSFRHRVIDEPRHFGVGENSRRGVLTGLLAGAAALFASSGRAWKASKSPRIANDSPCS